MEKMTNHDFIKCVAKKTGFSQKNIKEVIEAMDEIIIDEVNKDYCIKITPNISIYAVRKEERIVTNPRTGEKITAQPKTCPKAKFSKMMKDALN